MLRVGQIDNLSQKAIKAKVSQIFPDAEIQKVEYIGPQVGDELIKGSIFALIASFAATMLYIALRFETKFAFSAMVSLIHDPILILGIFAWFQIEFNLISLTALLTILGYSLNDTIVVYDRVRENFISNRVDEASAIVNQSINQTLSRTIMTSGLTLIVVLSLLFYGGETLYGFALALAIGIVIGTYSSIFIAGALSIALGLSRESLIKQPKRKRTFNRP